jgi:hypothetical protein
MGVESTNASLYFSAANSVASHQAAKSARDERAQKSDKAKKNLFSNAVEKARAEFELQQNGFPKEIAGLSVEESAVYLKDQADIAADNLKEHQTPEEFAEYRKKVSQFLRYVSKNNFEVKKRERRGSSASGKPLSPQFKIVVINQKLDEMARWLLNSHKDAFSLLARVNEISGLLVDLMAS